MPKYNTNKKKTRNEIFAKFKILNPETCAISHLVQLTFLYKPQKNLVGGALKKGHTHPSKRPYFIAKMSYCPVFY